MTFLNAALLFGLAVVVLPPIIHLFNRRRFDVVDWAAMQFLRLTPSARQKVRWEQLLLMLLRMGLLATLVGTLAAPAVRTSLFGPLTRGERDLVLVLERVGTRHQSNLPCSPAQHGRCARFATL